jgi:flagellar basal-body rod modification protein FlgD
MIESTQTTGIINDLQGTDAGSRNATGTLENGSLSNSQVTGEGDLSGFNASETMGKSEFLKLLITSLRYQDPLEPVGNEQFISQIAEFSALENSVNMTESLEKLTGSMEAMVENQNKASNTYSQASAISMLGKHVRFDSSEIDFSGKEINFKVHVNDNETALISIVNSKDEVVNYIPVNESGDSEVSWDGTKINGDMAPSGTYSIMVTNHDGTRDTGYAYSEDVVTGINYDSKGVMLEIGDRKKSFEDVIHVSEKAGNDGDG